MQFEALLAETQTLVYGSVAVDALADPDVVVERVIVRVVDSAAAAAAAGGADADAVADAVVALVADGGGRAGSEGDRNAVVVLVFVRPPVAAP